MNLLYVYNQLTGTISEVKVIARTCQASGTILVLRVGTGPIYRRYIPTKGDVWIDVRCETIYGRTTGSIIKKVIQDIIDGESHWDFKVPRDLPEDIPYLYPGSLHGRQDL